MVLSARRALDMTGGAVPSIRTLLQPLGGLAQLGHLFPPEADGPDLTTQTVDVGDIGRIFNRGGGARPAFHTQLSGAGVGLDPDDALTRALGEAIERYCASVFSETQFTRDSASGLGRGALDLDTVPRCSAAELSHPYCPLLAPDKGRPIRWVRGLSLLDGKVVFLPAIMVYHYAGVAGDGERFWLPISTGCAAHTTYEAALTAAICEIVERDALSVAWIQQLALPRLSIDDLNGEAATYWHRFARASAVIEYSFFDATTDLGVPVVLGIQRCLADRRRATLVACGCALDPQQAFIKVLREMVAHRVATQAPQPAPRSLDECSGLTQGAALMACAEQAGAFGFLFRSKMRRGISGVAGLPAGHDGMASLLDIFRRRTMGVFAVDLSTDEALRSGLRAVRVVIPSLQPFAYHYRARYLGHPRLYDAPRRMGYRPRGEAKLNPWPIPFA